MISIDEIDHRVRDAIQSAGRFADIQKFDTEGWTKRIKDHLGKLGKELGYTVCCSGSAPECQDYGEWLWDLCWLRYEGAAPHETLADIPIAVECEWGTNFDRSILPDFQKLIVSRARLRVMIFQGEKFGGELGAVFQKLIDAVRAFSGTPDDRYLFACFYKTAHKADPWEVKFCSLP